MTLSEPRHIDSARVKVENHLRLIKCLEKPEDINKIINKDKTTIRQIIKKEAIKFE